MDKTWTIAVTGAAGHVGGKLVEALRSSGMTVRALTRADGDVGDGAAMRRALDGVDAAFYLVHSLGSAGEFAAGEQRDAREFGAAARHCAVQRLVYLGGIAHGDDLSPHLQSRCDVGNTLRSSGVPTVELRASIVIGEGSASFEIVRDLVDRLPALVAPDWLENAAQPIAIDDVVAYLIAALDESIAPDAVYEIGGRDRVTYRDLVEEIALQAGSAMPIATVPVPRLPGVSQLPEWMAGLVPERARLAANLIESMRFDTAVEDDAAQRDFDVKPVGLREAVAAALATA